LSCELTFLPLTAVERFINVVRERGASIGNQVAEHVRMGDEHVEDVV
jgi:hypothetical protein